MAFGVDLGTTNSSIAWSDELGNVHSLRVRQGLIEPFDSVERSLVLDPESEDFVVGQTAVTEAAKRREPRLVRSFKRKFDKQRLRQHMYRHSYENTNEYDPVRQTVKLAESYVRVPLEYDEYSREEVIAAGGRLLNHLLTRVEIDAETESAGAALADLTHSAAGSKRGETLYIGVPVAFGPTARRRLLCALVASGCFGEGPPAYQRVLKQCRLVYEPLALMSTHTLFEPQNVIVLDYGGGTLDIAVLAVEFDKLESSIYKELALGGLLRAGDAIDELFRLALFKDRPGLKRAFERQVAGGSDYDVLQAEAAFANAKIRLSTNEAVDLPLFNERVTREELDNAIAPEIESAVASVRDALQRAGLVAADIGTVLLTGGSSLIPAVQTRFREEFEHVDAFSFVAGRTEDVDSRREALTGVSRGLARFGFLDRFETASACDYSIVVPGTRGKALCLARGTVDVKAISRSPSARVPIRAGHVTTFALYSDLVREAFCGAVVNVALPPGVKEVEIRVSASRERFAPAFAVYAAGSRKAVATFDLEGMEPGDLAAYVEGDAEWTPSNVEPSRFVLTKPLAVGDVVVWKVHGQARRGVVVAIREVASAEHVVEMRGFDPLPYVITVAREINRTVEFGRLTQGVWEVGEVRLA